jgi:hypothetical protein
VTLVFEYCFSISVQENMTGWGGPGSRCDIRSMHTGRSSKQITCRPFAAPHTPVLDCANGCQEENQEEVNEVEEKQRQEAAGEAASAERENSCEVGKKESRSEKTCGKEQDAEEDNRR